MQWQHLGAVPPYQGHPGAHTHTQSVSPVQGHCTTFSSHSSRVTLPHPATHTAKMAKGVKDRGKKGGKGSKPATPVDNRKPKNSNDANRPSTGTKGMRDAATVSLLVAAAESGGRVLCCFRGLCCCCCTLTRAVPCVAAGAPPQHVQDAANQGQEGEAHIRGALRGGQPPKPGLIGVRLPHTSRGPLPTPASRSS